MKHGVRDCYLPDKNNANNYVLDTSAINKLAERPEDLDIVVLGKEELGYSYFCSIIQIQEIQGMKSDGTFWNMSQQMQQKATKMLNIIETLPILRIPHMAALRPNTWILDGTCHLLEDSGKLHDVFCNVFSNKRDNLEDAIIIESAMRFECIVVSNDRAMCENTNAVYPGCAIWYKKFIEEIKEKLLHNH